MPVILTELTIATPFDSIYFGLGNYNRELACIAIGGMFYALTWQTHLMALICGTYPVGKGRARIQGLKRTSHPADLVSGHGCAGNTVRARNAHDFANVTCVHAVELGSSMCIQII